MESVKEVGVEDKRGGNRAGSGALGGRLQSSLPLESGDELGVLVTLALRQI